MRVVASVTVLLLSVSALPLLAQTAPVSTCIEAERFDDVSGVSLHASGSRLSGCTPQSWVLFRDVDFLEDVFDSVTVYTSTSWEYFNADFSYTADVEFRIDSQDGPIVARAEIDRNDSPVGAPWQGAFTTAVTGVHDVYVTFSAPRDTVCDFDRFCFRGTVPFSSGDAADYYVSTSGSDDNDGLTLETPFKTIQKAASVMIPGSRCLIRQGVYRETVSPAFSGLPGAPLTFEAYGSELVYISGADPITGWTQHQGNIFKATMPWDLGKYENQIIVNGKMAWMARYPNVDDNYVPHPWLEWCGSGFGMSDRRRWHTLAEPVATSQRVCLGGNGTDGYGEVGSSFNFVINQDGDANYPLPPEVFNRPDNFFVGGLVTTQAGYWMGSGLISSSNSTADRTEIYSGRINSMSQQISGGPGWISHLFELLDAPNEWYRDDDGTLYLWAPGGGDPSSLLVEAKRRVLGFDLTGKQHVILRKLRFIATSMTLKDAQDCLIQECQFKYVSHDDVPSEQEMGVYFQIDQNVGDGHLGIFLGGSNNTMRKCMVRGSAHSGVVIGGKYCTVSNCHITSCDYSVTYHAGILVIPDGPDWSEAVRPIGTVICSSYFAYNNRASIQVGVHTSSQDPQERIRIHNNIFGTCGYTSETGHVAVQSCGYGEATNNVFHDAAWLDVGSVVTENDFGGVGWIIHHNVFYQGDSAVVMTAKDGNVIPRCCDWTPDDEAMVFNNTVVDSTTPGHFDWQYMRSFNPDGTLSDVSWAMDRGNIIWPGDTAYWMFNDPDNRDYTLRQGSPAIDAGVVVPGWVDDFEGSAPDLGAFEFGREPWTAGPTWPEETWTYPPNAVAIGHAIDVFARKQPSRIVLSHRGGTLTLQGPRRVNRVVTVFDARGKMIRRARWDKGRRTLTIDTREWSSRVYVVKTDWVNGSSVRTVCAAR